MTEVPVKVYRTRDRLTVALPTPGLLAEDVTITVTADNHLVLDGEARGRTADRRVYNRLLQDQPNDGGPREVQEHWERLADEWSVGPYQRDPALAIAVNGSMATATYGNGVVVVTLPVANRTSPAELHLEPLGTGHGERVGSAGFPIRPLDGAEHRSAKARVQAGHGGHHDPHHR